MALGIDSVLVYTPYYVKIRESSSKSKVEYEKSETNQKQMVDIIRKNAKIAKVDIALLNVTDMQETDSEAFNDLRVLAEWMSQQNRFGGNLLMPGFNQGYTNQLIKKYGTPHLLFTGIVSIKRSRTHWIYWSVLFDLRDGRYQIIKEDYYRQKDTKNILNAHIFDTFFQIKYKHKKKKK